MKQHSLLFLVGALTSKPYAFIARPWELKSTITIDIFDTILSNIRVDVRGIDVLRILPANDTEVSWITDNVRFFYDGLRQQRVLRPLMRSRRGKMYLPVSLTYIFDNIAERIACETTEVLFVGGKTVEIETLQCARMFGLRWFDVVDFISEIGAGSVINTDFRQHYLLDSWDSALMFIFYGG